ncbi:MAG TPA: WbqC family protein [Pyrinomonadaceae bacterium]|nr:WbqC family protein [Pyrinomonadaceae bacterium]
MSAKNNRTLVVLQPGYLPWLGFFDQVYRSDIFVFYDDVQFDKNGWRNRNRIKSPAGPHWLTVPVRVNSLEQRIFETEIDDRQPWARKHSGTIKQFYAKAPYLKRYLPELEDTLMGRRWERLIDLDVAVIELLCRWLGIERRTLRSSELGVGGERSERLLNICLAQGAGRYLSGSAARSYLNTELFAAHGIEVLWQDYQHPVYAQQHGEFVPFLSALDLLLNCGDESAAIITGK